MTMLVGVWLSASQLPRRPKPLERDGSKGRKGVQMRKSARFKPLAARFLLVGASLVTLTSTRIGHAQPPPVDRNQKVVFDDDLLNADLGGPSGVQVCPGHMR